MKQYIFSALCLVSGAFCLSSCNDDKEARPYTPDYEIVPEYTNADTWKAYEAFNEHLLDQNKFIYKSSTADKAAVDRWNGAAAIWCQPTYWDMAMNAYKRAKAEGDTQKEQKFKQLCDDLFAGNKAHYANFDFDDNNENTGWFIYDDIMWWTVTLARAYELFGVEEYLDSIMVKRSSKEAFAALGNLVGGVEVLAKAKNIAPNSSGIMAVKRLEKIYDILALYGVEKFVTFDLSMSGSYGYYTGIIFRAYTYGTGDAVVRGGRYDHLLEKFGNKTPSIGFAIILDELMSALDRQKIKVRKWLDIPELDQYEKFVNDWHYFLKDVAASLRKENASDGTIKQINIYVLKEFYMRGFGEEVSFYAQFEQRLKEVKAVLLK